MNNNFVGDKELVICYAEGGVASLSTSILRYANKARKLAKEYADIVDFEENEDGSVYLAFPKEWIKFPSPKRGMSEENRKKAAERLREARKNKT